MASQSLRVPELVGRPCQICNWTTLQGSRLCVGCLDIREWSRVNREFCNLLHRSRGVIGDLPTAYEAALLRTGGLKVASVA